MAIVVPRHEPEVIKRIADRERGGDVEKVATSSVDAVFIGEARIVSRYQKAEELETMANCLLRLEAPIRRHVALFYCDSKAAACYEVKLGAQSKDWARGAGQTLQQLAWCIGDAIDDCLPFHNGLIIQGPDGKELCSFDPTGNGCES